MSKRKLNGDDFPEPDEKARESKKQKKASFDSFGLDPRLLQAIAKEKFANPTPVQAKAIPLALRGKDVLARSKTGSGKTAAYLLPILQAILRRKSHISTADSTATITALILVPTKELANQITKALGSLTAFCTSQISTTNLTSQVHEIAQRAMFASSPDVIVSTPARALRHINTSAFDVSGLAHLVIDEADLVMSYGYEQDFQELVKILPDGVQTFLASATLSTEVDSLKGLFMRDPIVLDLHDEEKDTNTLTQYVVRCSEEEKFLLLFAVFKLKLVQGKVIVFAGGVDRCYRIKLFLEQFGVRSCVLNSELPVNCRIHVVEEFNRNVYDILVATDEHEVVGVEEDKAANKYEKKAQTEENEAASKDQLQTTDEKQTKKQQKGPRRRNPDKEYGISRGLDFQRVTCVLNFDLPSSSKSYTHRIGRTARAGRAGIALSFCVPADKLKVRPSARRTQPTRSVDETILEATTAAQKKKGQKLQPYDLDMKKLEGFGYRVGSALKAVSPGAVRQARIAELKGELLKSEKLKRHLEENPKDARWLRHDLGVSGGVGVRSGKELRDVPRYLLPKGRVEGMNGDDAGPTGGDGPSARGLGLGFVGIRKTSENRIRKNRERNKARGRTMKAKRTAGKEDPLKTFNAKGRGI